MQLRLREFLAQLASNPSSDFVGLGLIFYSSFDGLPVFPLGNQAVLAGLPLQEEEEIKNYLLDISRRSSPWHDGFHLLDVRSGQLTHVAQFVSPPLDFARTTPAHRWPSGARHMAALLASTLPQVVSSVVVPTTGPIHVYQAGHLLPYGGASE